MEYYFIVMCMRRSFIWFHHIYSKKKQKAIFRWATELDITGRDTNKIKMSSTY